MWKDNFDLVDFHSHIIPNIDDGASDFQTALNMLSMLSAQGVDKVVATSHYYNSGESITSFVKKRDKSLSELLELIDKEDLKIPAIIPASEVRIYPEMHKDEELYRLCVANSKKILVEMPYTAWSDWMYGEIYALTARGYVPIMAHVERYVELVGAKEIEEKLLRLNVLVQTNADFLLSRKEKRFVKHLIEKDRLTVLGSDCHNTTTRCPRLYDAFSYISQKYGDEYLMRLMSNALSIINE